MRSPVRLPSTPDLTVLAAHIATRLALASIYVYLPYRWKSLAWGDLTLYSRWAADIGASGAAPAEVSWMYPPGAAGVLLAISVVPLAFSTAFILCLVVVDAAVLALLLSAGSHRAGGWAWALLPPMLGLICWARLDLLAVACAAGAVMWATTRPRLAGVLAAVGTAVKAWPVLLGVLYLRSRALLVTAVVTGVVSAALATLVLDGAWDFVARLAGRGTQVESVLATPWLVRQSLGFDVDGGFSNGSYELFGPGTVLAARLGSLLVVVLVSVAWWVSRRHHPAVRWWAMVMALLSASPLLSTQFVLWIIGACAVAATLPGPDGQIARRGLPAVAVIAVLSHSGFPVQWFDLTAGDDIAALTVVVRNVLLVATTAWLLVSLARSIPPDPPRPATPAAAASTIPTTTAAQPVSGRRPHVEPLPPAGRAGR